MGVVAVHHRQPGIFYGMEHEAQDERTRPDVSFSGGFDQSGGRMQAIRGRVRQLLRLCDDPAWAAVHVQRTSYHKRGDQWHHVGHQPIPVPGRSCCD